MKKSTRIRPAVESLESMMLLSTVVAHVHELATTAAHVAPVVPTVSAEATVTLHGNLTGSGKVSGTAATVSGSGNLGSVGATSFKTKINLLSPPTNVTLTTAKKGSLYLQASSALVGSGSSGSTTYSIVGGTKSYAGATGSGTVIGSYSLVKGKLSVTLRFS